MRCEISDFAQEVDGFTVHHCEEPERGDEAAQNGSRETRCFPENDSLLDGFAPLAMTESRSVARGGKNREFRFWLGSW
jgi:hypothetical protein